MTIIHGYDNVMGAYKTRWLSVINCLSDGSYSVNSKTNKGGYSRATCEYKSWIMPPRSKSIQVVGSPTTCLKLYKINKIHPKQNYLNFPPPTAMWVLINLSGKKKVDMTPPWWKAAWWTGKISPTKRSA